MLSRAAMSGESMMSDHDDQVERILRDCGRLYRDVSLKSFQIGDDRSSARKRQALESVISYLKDAKATLLLGRNLVLYGTCGTGKDHLAIAAAKLCCQRGFSARFVTGAELIASAERNRRNGQEPVDPLFKTCRVLVLSDPLPNATELRSDELRYMMQLVDARYREQLPIFVTVNAENEQDLQETMRGPLGDRLLGDAVVVEMRWSTYRKGQRAGKEIVKK